MSKIITYKNAGASGCFCQIKLSSGERILISIAQDGILISKLGVFGIVPTKTIARWEISELSSVVELFGDELSIAKHPLDVIKEKCLICQSISDIEKLCVPSKQQLPDAALAHIASKIGELNGIDKEFAQAMITSAWGILTKLANSPINSTVFEATSTDYSRLKAYKYLLCHHCMLMFFRDESAKHSIRKMITNITDNDPADTDSICNHMENACQGLNDASVSICITTSLWTELCPILKTEPRTASLATMVIVSYFSRAKEGIRHCFN
jgi:hypothetical protein